MKRYIARLLCLALLLQLCFFGVSAAPEQNEKSGLEAFSQMLQQSYTLVETPREDGSVLVELVMPTEENCRRQPAAKRAAASPNKPGDLDGNGQVNADDVVALLLYVSMPDVFTIQGNGDLDHSGAVNTDDVVMLLLHVSMPDTFPLEPTEPEPTEPEPTEPEPTEPEPTEPEPTEPEPTEPEPTEPEGHKTLPYTGRYLYNTLSETEKGWYRSIDTAVNALEGEVFLGYGLPDDYFKIFYLYLMDNPEHFYLCSRISYYPGSYAKLLFCYSDGVYASGSGYGEMTQELRNGIAAKKAIFNEKVEAIVAKIPTDIPDVEKEKMAYDHLLLNSYYNIDAVTNNLWDGLANDNWTAYGVMIHGTGVCESYAEAFQTLCLRMGINCTGITGYANGGGHKWNAVELEGQWYACDVTFDDPIGGAPDYAYHDYFNITTKEMENLAHSTEGSDHPGPVCTGTKYSYKNYFTK